MTETLPSNLIMREMARIAVETATSGLADQADIFAADPMVASLSGPEALKAFAEAIRSRNHKAYGGAKHV